MTLLQTYLGSAEIKKCLIARSNDLGIPFKLICEKVGFKYQTFLNEYLNHVGVSAMKISQEKFEEIMSYLGVETRVNIILLDIDAEAIKDKLRNGEGTTTGF